MGEGERELANSWVNERFPNQLLPPLLSAGIAVGFYGNGETSDGIHRVTYSLRHANRTVAGVQDRVNWENNGPGNWP